MKIIETTKKDLLSKKITEFFNKNPRKKSAIFEVAVDHDVTFWSVRREKSGLKIERMLKEAPVGQIAAQEKQAADQQAKELQAQMQPPPPPPGLAPGPAMAPVAGMAPELPPMPMPPPPAPEMMPPPDPGMTPPMPAPPPAAPMPPSMAPPPEVPGAGLPPEAPGKGKVNWDKVIDTLDQLKLKDPSGYQERFGATVNQQLQDPNVAPEQVLDTEPPDRRGGKKTPEARNRKGKVLREAPLAPPPMPVPAAPQGVPQPQPVPPPQKPPEPVDVPFAPGVTEESALVRALKGQTVKDVSLVNDEKSTRIEIVLVSTKWPVVIEYERGGKITLTNKDRRYTLQKKWS